MSTKKPAPVFPAPEWTSVSSSLAAALAHEIRNPLLAIKGAAQLLESVVGEDDKTLAQLIITEAARIEKLIATMDPLTPNPAQGKVALNIHEITEYVRKAAAGFAPGVRILAQYDPSLPEVLGERESLIQAMMNLVKNAVEAVSTSRDAAAPLPAGEATRLRFSTGHSSWTDGNLSRSGEGAYPQTQPRPHSDLQPNSEVEFGQIRSLPQGETTPASPPTITLTTRYLVGERMQRPDGGKLPIQVSVTDNGAGVATDVVPRLFTPFSGTKEGGKGLGLAITAKIIEEHGGLIAYDAPPEGGARFSIYLPVG